MLTKLYDHIAITDVIADEFGEPLPGWIAVHPVKNRSYQKLLEATLDPGEASAIALAMETENPLLVIDDLKGRKEATRIGLMITGTLGVLAKARERGIIGSLSDTVNGMQAAGFRIAPEIVRRLLEHVNEVNRVAQGLAD